MNSTLNPDNEPVGPDEDNARRGRDGCALGPGDSSDSGSDTAGAGRHPFDIDSPLDSDTDRTGTGERASADGDSTLHESADIEPDRTERLSGPDRADESEDPGGSGGHRRIARYSLWESYAKKLQ